MQVQQKKTLPKKQFDTFKCYICISNNCNFLLFLNLAYIALNFMNIGVRFFSVAKNP